MLYVTTRIHGDAFTAYHALTENRGPGGGLYLPMRLMPRSREQIFALGEKSFGQNVADVLNLLFNTKLDGWTVEATIGRHPVNLVGLGNKVHVAELWNHPQQKFEQLVRNLAGLVLAMEEAPGASEWMHIGARMGMLFGIYGSMVRFGLVRFGEMLDMAVPSGDLSQGTAAFYARKLGLPIGNIVISCNENNGLWNLMHQGELKTDPKILKTGLPKCDDAGLLALERLIFSTLGPAQAERFQNVAATGGIYRLSDFRRKRLGNGFRVSVVSQQRTEAMISGIFGSGGYIPDPYTTLAYCGLTDYRAGEGESGPALILSEDSPRFFVDMISGALGMGKRELIEWIERS